MQSALVNCILTVFFVTVNCLLTVLKLHTSTGTETKFAGSSCNDLVTSDGAGSTIISGHFDKRIRFWDIRTEMSANHIMLQGKVTSLDLSRGNFVFVC